MCPLLTNPFVTTTMASLGAFPQIRSAPGTVAAVLIRARVTLVDLSSGMLSNEGLSPGATDAPMLDILESTPRFQPTAFGSNPTLEFEISTIFH